jgi:hypothetical protein
MARLVDARATLVQGLMAQDRRRDLGPAPTQGLLPW